MDSVTVISALGDNFIYLCRADEDRSFVVDPSDSSPVLHAMQACGTRLTKLFATHAHWDHVAGIAELKTKTGCEVIGSDDRRIPGIDRVVRDGEVLEAGKEGIRVIATPGHTRSSLCYYMLPSQDNPPGILWTGDTLFTGGCGRLLECDATTMWQSLQKLSALPQGTLVYCGHDYAVENYEFALSIEPDNNAVRQQLEQIKRKIGSGGQTVPSTIGQEMLTNPFLRADTSELKTALRMPAAAPAEVFAELRQRKDMF
ncbi:MAG: hydroxyacylglutathione hydrolase [Planctomycetota bacterium]